MAKNLKLKVFVDFDGTLVREDVGDEFFKEFSEFEENHSKLMNGQIDIHEYYRIVTSKINIELLNNSFDEFISRFEIDPNFQLFSKFCNQNNIEIIIISDGFDFYIDKILNKSGIYIKTYSNKLSIQNNQVKTSYPFATESCNCMCASCKRNILLKNLGDDEIAVYIGDGLSDFCAAKHSDYVFGKKKLSAECNKFKLSHFNWSNFFDVYRIFSNLVLSESVKNRFQASLNRKKAFETE